jgi:hypothetical protein
VSRRIDKQQQCGRDTRRTNVFKQHCFVVNEKPNHCLFVHSYRRRRIAKAGSII